MIKRLALPFPYPPQQRFFQSRSKYTAYGGARGGGKSAAARIKAVLLALRYPGIQILLLRRTLIELKENHVIPLFKMLNGFARYREVDKEFIFPNTSRIKLGYCDNERDVLQYQGQAYEVIFMEEATQFTLKQFQTLTESNRLSGQCREPFSPRMYLTCNPGGVGHEWVKRLFITRDYQKQERPEDYTFIPSRVYDNDFLMQNDPDYVRTLENLPEMRRRAMLDGDWDVFEGQYFAEFNRDLHVVRPFAIPDNWIRYFVMDYGMDMLAGYFIAMSPEGRAYIYKEIYKSGLLVSGAAELIKSMTSEDIFSHIAPPDMWNRLKDTGKSIAEIFGDHGLYLQKADNDRVTGWLNLREWLRPIVDEQGQQTANLVIFDTCPNLIRTLPQLQHCSRNPEDAAKEPHELTHAPDAIRYFLAGRPIATQIAAANPEAHIPHALRTDTVQGDGVIDW